jgi:ABC-type polar amino acid transport system ATPase subunit
VLENKMAGNGALSVEELQKSYNGRPVLRHVSLSVAPGDVVAIVGPSGCGKSTLLRCISGLEPFEKGVVRVNNVQLKADLSPAEFRRAAREVRRSVGMVFQQFHLFPHRTALENVMAGPLHALGMSPKEARARAEALLERVGLAHRMHAYPESLSGGEQQRVAIARALATDPEVLLLDEPTSALDPPRAAEVREVITSLAAAGQTMVIVTHSLNFARHTARILYIMGDGQIIEWGPPQVILENPGHESTRRLIEAARVT